MIIYLRILPLSLKHDNTIWLRVDDSWWSFPFAWIFLVRLASHLELFMSFLSPRLHPFFLILLSCHLFALWSWHLVGPSAPLAVLCSSSIHDEWAVSSLCNVIGVCHVPCFISDLDSSRDLPKLNWEFPAGVSPTKYPISTKAYYRLKNQPRHHV